MGIARCEEAGGGSGSRACGGVGDRMANGSVVSPGGWLRDPTADRCAATGRDCRIGPARIGAATPRPPRTDLIRFT